VDRSLSLGSLYDFEEANGEWRNYLELGFCPQRIPDLTRLHSDESLRSEAVRDNEFTEGACQVDRISPWANRLRIA
jgi:hypothetical protein